MRVNILESNLTPTDQELESQENQEGALRDKLLSLELQLRIYKQAESIGELGYWQINLNTFETWYSENLFRIYGVEPYSLSSHCETFDHFIHKDERKIVLSAFERSYQEKIPLHLEFRIVRQDGTQRHLKIISTIIKNSVGEPLLTGITQDITERKILELQLRKSNEEMDLQNEASLHAEQLALVGTWQMNLNTRQTNYSANFYRIFGIKPLPVPPGLDFFIEFLHVDDKQILFNAIRKIFEEKQAPEAAFRIMKHDGRIRYVELKTKLTNNADGDLLVLGVIKDVTAQTQMEQQYSTVTNELILANEVLKDTERSVNIGTWTWDLTSNEIRFSDQVYILFGLKPQSLKPVFESFLLYVHPIDRAEFQKMLTEIKQPPAEYNFSFRIVRMDSRTRHLKLRAQLITPIDGASKIVGTIQDISEHILMSTQVRERTSFARILSENIIDKVCITDAFNNIIGWNSSSELAFELTKEEVLGKNIFELFPQLKNNSLSDLFKQVLNGEMVHVPLFVHPYAKGYHELTMIPIRRDDSDEVTAVLSFMHDITEHQMMKEDLEERLNFIEKLLESSVERIIVLDKNMRLIYWNKKSAEFYGIEKEYVIGKNLIEVFPQLRQQPIFPKLKQAMTGETVHIPVDRESITRVYTDVFLIPIKNASEQVAAVLWITHDLTNIIQAENEIRKRNELLQQASDIAHLGRWELDLESKVFVWSDEIYHLYGYPPQSFEPTLDFYYATSHAEDRERLAQSIEKASAGISNKNTIRIHALDGRVRYVQSLVTPLAEQGEKVSKLIGTVLDITDQKTFEQDVAQRSDKIRRQNLLQNDEELLKRSGNWQWSVVNREMVWSEGLYKLFGVESFSVSPTLENLISFVREEDKAQVLQELLALRTQDIQRKIIEFCLEYEGKKKFIRCIARVVNSAERYVVGSMFDITEIVELQQEFAERGELIEDLVESNVDAIIGVDRDMKICVWNKLAETTFNYSKDFVIARPIFEILKPAFREAFLGHLKQAFVGQYLSQHSSVLNGSISYSHVRYVPLIKNGNIYAVLIILRGIRVSSN